MLLISSLNLPLDIFLPFIKKKVKTPTEHLFFPKGHQHFFQRIQGPFKKNAEQKIQPVEVQRSQRSTLMNFRGGRDRSDDMEGADGPLYINPKINGFYWVWAQKKFH